MLIASTQWGVMMVIEEGSSRRPDLCVGVLRETLPGERRVAAVPDTVTRLLAAGAQVLVERGAGEEAYFPDAEYAEAGATIAESAAQVYGRAQIIVKVRAPSPDELGRFKRDSTLLGFLGALTQPELIQALEGQGVNALSMDAIPRITRAQNMDALSSMSTIAGYKAVLVGAAELARFFPMLMTAAGTLKPARVLVLGAGVAGLQALATARRLGAVTEAFDTRPVVREQVESVGASFIEMEVHEEAEGSGGYAKEMTEEFYRHEQEAIREQVARASVVITTALIPGRPAPVLVTQEMVESMSPGSVVIDLAAEMGGNCTLTRADERVQHRGVTILGPTNLPASVPHDASQMYARNVYNVLNHIIKDGRLQLDREDEITKAVWVGRGSVLVGASSGD